MKEIILAGGCFWGVEEFFSRIDGVEETKVGYANGELENPSYEQVKTQMTGYAEVVHIQYDEEKVNLETILERFWGVIDPTVENRQGPDIGSQYRTGIFYTDEKDEKVILKSKEEEQEKYLKPIVTQVEPLKKFYLAEEYHQRYLKKNPNGYCHIKM
ncbi:MAG: peptide-methionine (S)-S-oxide reductase MsrA [Epulopiscium sp.]|nr:peptide-methionine (S)-S-oxide reductase MsrA [Candidatus Epulonipiscium sp.]